MPARPIHRAGLLAGLACLALAASRPPLAFADARDDVPEARDYTLVYALDIPDTAAFNSSDVPYTVDRHVELRGSFDRVAYYLTLARPGEERRFAWASMTAFTDDLGQVGVPVLGRGARFQQRVAALNVVGNVPGLAPGSGLAGGSIEFWPTNYGPANGAGIPGASDATYDFGDQPVAEGGYGSLQVHDFDAGRTILAYNAWGQGGRASDLGLGSNVVSQADGTLHPDWTFRGNAAEYSVKRLEVWVRPGPAPVSLRLSEPSPHAVLQRDNSGRAWLPLAGRLLGEVIRVEARALPVPGFGGAATDWTVVDPSPRAGHFHGHLLLNGGWYRVELRGVGPGGAGEVAAVEPVGVGEVFVTAGQSNSANHGNPPLAPADPRVSAWGPAGWRPAADPQPIATGSGGTPWPALGDRLAARWDLPIGFVSVGWGGTSVAEWQPGGTLYPRLQAALDDLGPHGARAVLWHQGETDAANGTTTADYARLLTRLIASSRQDAGYDVPWGIARVSFLPGGTAAQMDPIVAAQVAVVAADPLAFLGPTTDDLVGTDWRWDGIHFNEAGLREHARRWAEALVLAELLPEQTPEPDPTPAPASLDVYLPALWR